MAGNGHASHLWKGDAPFVVMLRRLLETSSFFCLKGQTSLLRRLLSEASFLFAHLHPQRVAESARRDRLPMTKEIHP